VELYLNLSMRLNITVLNLLNIKINFILRSRCVFDPTSYFERSELNFTHLVPSTILTRFDP
jgi:hypothetical protein